MLNLKQKVHKRGCHLWLSFETANYHFEALISLFQQEFFHLTVQVGGNSEDGKQDLARHRQ